jgi:hypothetical protein
MREETQARNNILSKAGKYTLLLKRSDYMFSTIFADIEKRDVKIPWDRLVIGANCCQYPIRLDIGQLQQRGYSLSLSMLTMCLLNGEILYNNGEAEPTHTVVPRMAVSRYLKDQFFDAFIPPGVEYSLTFNKACRFIDVELRASGVMTKGHLWKLGRIIRTAEFSSRLPWIEELYGSLKLH